MFLRSVTGDCLRHWYMAFFLSGSSSLVKSSGLAAGVTKRSHRSRSTLRVAFSCFKTLQEKR